MTSFIIKVSNSDEIFNKLKYDTYGRQASENSDEYVEYGQQGDDEVDHNYIEFEIGNEASTDNFLFEIISNQRNRICLLYTSDAADE